MQLGREGGQPCSTHYHPDHPFPLGGSRPSHCQAGAGEENHQELFHLHDAANVDVDDIEVVDFDFDVDDVDVDVLLLMLLLCWPGGGGAPDSVRPGEERRGEESVLGGSSQGPPCEM